MNRLRHRISALCIGVALLGIAYADKPVATQPLMFEIDAQPLSTALTRFAKQADVQIVMYSEVSEGLTAPRVHGKFTPEEALQLLLTNTPLRFELINDRKTVAIRTQKTTASAPTDPASARTQANGENSGLRLATVMAGTDDDVPPTKRTDASKTTEGADRTDSTMIVTGTQIRGVKPIGSPLMVFTSEDFERTGSATLQQFFSTLPQNFAGGRNDGVRTSAYGRDGSFTLPPNDSVEGSALNLRGLGTGATLVLVNGRRVANTGLGGEYADISMIPLSAVERVELLLDGASASYGADAIAGVVNVILRKQYRGAETQVQAGTTTQGGGDMSRFAQSIGTGWTSGNGLATFEHYLREPINMTQRSFVNVPINVRTNNLYGRQKRDSAYLSMRQSLSERLDISADASFSERTFDNTFVDAFFQNDFIYSSTKNQQYGGSIGVDFEVGNQWKAQLWGKSDKNKSDITGGAFLSRVLAGTAFPSKGMRSNASHYASASISGDIFRQLPSGPIKTAFGLEYTKNSIVDISTSSSGVVSTNAGNGASFSDKSAFAEFLIPLVAASPSTGNRSTPRLAVSLSGRYDQYSIYGDSFNPKFGILWKVSNALQLRGTYGTSFRTPTVNQTDVIRRRNGQEFILNDPRYTAGQKALVLFGNNDALVPETAKSWTIGADIAPRAIKGFNAQLTYFDIRYENRIESPPNNNTIVLYDPAYLDLRVFRGDIPAAEFNALVAYYLTNSEQRAMTACIHAVPGEVFTPCLDSVTDFSAIVNRDLRNLAATRDSGLDLVFDHQLSLSSSSSLNFNLNLAYVSHFTRQVTANAPSSEEVNTIYRPRRWTTNAGFGWERGGLSTLGIVRYGGDYRNTYVPTNASDFPSFTTLDINLRYAFGQRFKSWMSNATIGLNISNAFDRDPPTFLEPQFLNTIAYDATKFDAIGRAISVTITKDW